MKLPLRVLPAAIEDIRETKLWYDSNRVGLGDEFLLQLDYLLDAIEDRPMSFPVVAKSARRALMSRFPYCVYYSTGEGEVVVLAVVHGRRSPNVWRSRTPN